jgi:hypothetical protein
MTKSAQELPLSIRKPRAFVISPIGGENDNGKDERRVYADAVFTRIIAPACEQLGIEAVRGDMDRDSNDIMGRIIEGINDHEFVIAVLSEKDLGRVNANVFYELGVAHAAGRPAILLRHADQGLPIDLALKEAIPYYDVDLSGARDPMDPGGPRPGGETAPPGPGYKLFEELRRRMDQKRHYERPFGKDVALGRQGVRDRQQSVTPEQWSRMILEADAEIFIAGTTLLTLADRQDPTGNIFFMPDPNSGALSVQAHLSTLLAFQMAAGVDVTILMNHPDNPMNWLINQEGRDADGDGIDDGVNKVRADAQRSFELWSRWRDQAIREYEAGRAEGRFAAVPGRYRVIQVRRNAVLHRMFATEKRALLTPNFYHTPLKTTPAIDARAEPITDKFQKSAHAYILDDLRYLADLNEGIEKSPPLAGPQRLPPTPEPPSSAGNGGGFFGIFKKPPQNS